MKLKALVELVLMDLCSFPQGRRCPGVAARVSGQRLFEWHIGADASTAACA
jgi:hypothetical protein